MSLSTSLRLIVGATLQGSGDLSTPEDKLNYTFSDSLADGALIDQADEIWHDQRTVDAGVDDDLDLAGVLTNALGDTVTFAKIKAIILENTSVTAGDNLRIGGGEADAGTNAFDTWLDEAGGAADGGINQVIVGPGGCFCLFNPSLAGYGVTAGTADILRIANTTASNITYNIILIGVST